jgi:hypothetical protein
MLTGFCTSTNGIKGSSLHFSTDQHDAGAVIAGREVRFHAGVTNTSNFFIREVHPASTADVTNACTAHSAVMAANEKSELAAAARAAWAQSVWNPDRRNYIK